jgi:hypothetical protein
MVSAFSPRTITVIQSGVRLLNSRHQGYTKWGSPSHLVPSRLYKVVFAFSPRTITVIQSGVRLLTSHPRGYTKRCSPSHLVPSRLYKVVFAFSPRAITVIQSGVSLLTSHHHGYTKWCSPSHLAPLRLYKVVFAFSPCAITVIQSGSIQFSNRFDNFNGNAVCFDDLCDLMRSACECHAKPGNGHANVMRTAGDSNVRFWLVSRISGNM